MEYFLGVQHLICLKAYFLESFFVVGLFLIMAEFLDYVLVRTQAYYFRKRSVKNTKRGANQKN